MTRLCVRTPDVEERERLERNIIDWVNDESETPARVELIAGLLLLGQSPSSFCVTRTHDNSTKGAQLALSSMIEYADIAQTLDEGFPRAHKTWQSIVVPYCFYTRSSFAAATWASASGRILGNEGAILLAAARNYSFEAYFARFLSTSGVCFAFVSGLGVPVMVMKYANLTIAQSLYLKYEDTAHKAKAAGGASYVFQIAPGSGAASQVWPILQNVGNAVGNTGGLEKQFRLWGVDWNTSKQWAAQKISQDHHSWSYSSDGRNIDVRYNFGDAITVRL
jgi:hypothetical protein